MRVTYISEQVLSSEDVWASFRAVSSVGKNTTGEHRNDMSIYLPIRSDQTLDTYKLADAIA